MEEKTFQQKSMRVGMDTRPSEMREEEIRNRPKETHRGRRNSMESKGKGGKEGYGKKGSHASGRAWGEKTCQLKSMGERNKHAS